MGSFGQGGFGHTAFGGSMPTGVYVQNLGSINASAPAFQLAADHPDRGERMWFDAQLWQSGAMLIQWRQHIDLTQFSIERTPVRAIGGFVVLEPTGIVLTPGVPYQLRIRATTDPDGEAPPSRKHWWTDWSFFNFQAGLEDWNGTITDFFLWETIHKDVGVPSLAECHGSTPFAQWSCDKQADYYVWGVSQDSADASMPFKTKQGMIDFNLYPLFDGTWIVRVAPVYGGTIGNVYHHKFTVAGTILNVS